MWNCVEDRVGNDKYGGRVIRRIIFDDIYADRIAVLSQNPISRAAYPHLKSGDKVVFYDNCEIKEGSFLLSSEQKSTYLNPKTIIGEVLSTEEEIRNFCKSHGIAKNAQSLHTLVIEAYLFLERKMSSAREAHFPDNTGSRMSSPMSRKRPAPVMNEQLAQAKASRILNAMGFPNPALAVPPLSSAPNLSPIAIQAQQLALQQQISSKKKETNKEENDENQTQSKKAKKEGESIVEPKSPEKQGASENSNSIRDIQANSETENNTEADISEIEIKTEPTGGEIAVVELEENHDDNLPLDQLPGPSNTNNVFQNPSDFQLSNNQFLKYEMPTDGKPRLNDIVLNKVVRHDKGNKFPIITFHVSISGKEYQYLIRRAGRCSVHIRCRKERDCRAGLRLYCPALIYQNPDSEKFKNAKFKFDRNHPLVEDLSAYRIAQAAPEMIQEHTCPLEVHETWQVNYELPTIQIQQEDEDSFHIHN